MKILFTHAKFLHEKLLPLNPLHTDLPLPTQEIPPEKVCTLPNM